MADQIETNTPDGVLVSTDAGTPSAFPGHFSASRPADGPDFWQAPLSDLEFPAVLDEVAARAAGPLGAASVRARRPSTDTAQVREELVRVDQLARLARGGRGVVAESVPEATAILGRLRIPGSVLDGQELLALRRTLTAARLVVGELRRVAADAPQVAPLEAPLPVKPLEKRLEQALDDDGGVRDTASPALAEARSDIRTARERLVQKLEVILRAVGGEGGVTLRDGRYVIPVPRDLRTRPDGIIHGESASGATLYLEPAAVIGLGNALREAEARATREELKVLRDLSEGLRPHVAELRALHQMCVAVDDLVARARWAAEVDGHAPVVVTAPAELCIVRGRHPLLLASEPASGRSAAPPVVVPFDLTIAEGERTILLSGPNTGGKSVLLKAVGLHVALAQSGIIPPVGPGSALPVCRRIFSDIGDRQSIAASLSTFSAHLTLLREILDDADEGSLVLLDEVGSGTDPAEGAALAAAALVSLTRRGALTLATTHLGALKRIATSTPGVVNASLQFDAATLRPTYLLAKGVPGRSYGLAIARRLGVRADVLAEAEAQVPDAERTLDALLAQVEARDRALALREEELRVRLEVAEDRTAALAAQAEAQEIRDTALRKREREAEKSAREQARAFLLDAREKVEAAIAKAGEARDESAREARRAVEQAAAEAAGALRAMDDLERRLGGPAAASLAPGTRVRMESGTIGHVLEVRGDGKAVVRVGSLKLVVEPASLTPLAEAPGRRRVEAPSREPTDAASFELDLRGLTGEEAEQTVLAALDAAVLAEQPYLRIIHGKGTGVVRDRVQQVLRRDRRVRSHAFAPANQGGTGVTVVEFAG
ncbi:MAG: Smr/MutS family protein [Gemmatimonadetes bacterium]|nr:Smr/MutS family protein [Gemmatimonadota bacterium]